ncbi:MAG: hypothetical protein O3B31_13510 [Chloroflexi bacterium]|nr:hypothetical protein [Chloroflexota bacterium]MDA1004339.1 hypothetical protein [Chloroflexota bacterium]
MTLEVAVIALVRVSDALPVLRWAFVGALIAIAVDLSDLFLMNLLHLGGVPNYQAFDKWADQTYQLTFLIVALRWTPVPRRVAVAAYAYRAAGFVLFELTGARWVLFAFPNVFEFWFVFVASLPHWRPAFAFTRRSTGVALAAVAAAKLAHEFTVHIARAFDGFTAVEAVRAIWRALTSPFA